MLVNTNKIVAKINYKNIYSDYNVLTKDLESSWKKSTKQLYELKSKHKIAALIYMSDSKIVYLQEKKQDIDQDSKIYEDLNKLENFKVVNLLFQLLIDKTSFFGISEQPNKLYYIVKQKKADKVNPEQIVTLCIEVDKESCLQTKVVTFSNMEYRKCTKYSLEGRVMRLSKETDEVTYIMKGNKFNKNNIAQFSSLIDEYEKTKDYFRGLLLNDIEFFLKDYLLISFEKKDFEIFKDLTHRDRRKKLL